MTGRCRITGNHILGRLPQERLWLIQQGRGESRSINQHPSSQRKAGLCRQSRAMAGARLKVNQVWTQSWSGSMAAASTLVLSGEALGQPRDAGSQLLWQSQSVPQAWEQLGSSYLQSILWRARVSFSWIGQSARPQWRGAQTVLPNWIRAVSTLSTISMDPWHSTCNWAPTSSVKGR